MQNDENRPSQSFLEKYFEKSLKKSRLWGNIIKACPIFGWDASG
jgi:hypothetical protein